MYKFYISVESLSGRNITFWSGWWELKIGEERKSAWGDEPRGHFGDGGGEIRSTLIHQFNSGLSASREYMSTLASKLFEINRSKMDLDARVPMDLVQMNCCHVQQINYTAVISQIIQKDLR